VAAGRVIVLNGTSSAGKSTLAAALQARLAAAGECWIVVALDDLFAKLPFAWVTYGDHVGAHADEGIAFELVDGEVVRRVGPIAERILDAYRGMVARAALAGLDVIVDEVLLGEAEWRSWQVELAGLEVRWVRVDCALDVAEARERSRPERLPGMARSLHGTVHRHPSYDLRVDTSATVPDTAAAAIVAGLAW
jgi:chloramphenicol 3-O phosphotransferase